MFWKSNISVHICLRLENARAYDFTRGIFSVHVKHQAEGRVRRNSVGFGGRLVANPLFGREERPLPRGRVPVGTKQIQAFGIKQ